MLLRRRISTAHPMEVGGGRALWCFLSLTASLSQLITALESTLVVFTFTEMRLVTRLWMVTNALSSHSFTRSTLVEHLCRQSSYFRIERVCLLLVETEWYFPMAPSLLYFQSGLIAITCNGPQVTNLSDHLKWFALKQAARVSRKPILSVLGTGQDSIVRDRSEGQYCMERLLSLQITPMALSEIACTPRGQISSSIIATFFSHIPQIRGRPGHLQR